MPSQTNEQALAALIEYARTGSHEQLTRFARQSYIFCYNIFNPKG